MALLAKLGVETVSDLLHYYPKDWQDRRSNTFIASFREPQMLVFFGKVIDAREITRVKHIGLFKALLSDGVNEVEALWFKKRLRSFDVFANIKKHFEVGKELWIIGKTDPLYTGPCPKVNVEEFYDAADEQALKMHVNRIVPVYALTAGITAQRMRESVYNALTQYALEEREILPKYLLEKRGLLNAAQSLRGLHFPGTMAEMETAKKRIIYEEFLLLGLAWAIKRFQTKQIKKNYGYQIKRHLLTPFKEHLGFEFTHAQVKVINEIFKDMLSPSPMTRLLQGDVGSGKTVVALSALLLASENGYQSAFMAPTEILAEQHFYTIKKFIGGLPVKCELITSKTQAAKKKKIIEALGKGEIDIVVGTHALLEENVKFKNLKFAVIDEQHRFGVKQRTILKNKALGLDMLIMTATPIPRTLALAFYGDLDISVIDEMPKGRIPIITKKTTEDEAFGLAKTQLAAGKQVYIVYPLIEGSEKLQLKAVSAECEKAAQYFKGYKTEMLHGKMNSKDKAAVMERFVKGETHILAATTVIEVGIDVPNATVMIIQNAERFGLASLHQLRGRVGRSSFESYCLLVPEKNSEQSQARIDIMCRTNDGFKIGEEDMKMRGPGEVLGTRQHGEIELTLADMFRDKNILEEASHDRDLILANDPGLKALEHQALKEKLLDLYHKKWNLIDLS